MSDGIIGQLRDRRAAFVPTQTFFINHSGSGTKEICGALNGKAVVLHALEVTCKSAATITLTTHLTSFENPLGPAWFVAAGGILQLPFNPWGWVISGPTQDMGVTITSATAVGLLAVVSYVDNDLVITRESAGGIKWDSSTVSIAAALTTLTLQVDRVDGLVGDLSLNYKTTNGTALSGTNYIAVDLDFGIDEGIPSTTVNIPILLDTVIVPVTFTVALTSVGGGGTIVTPGTCTVTITP